MRHEAAVVTQGHACSCGKMRNEDSSPETLSLRRALLWEKDEGMHG